MQCITTRVHGVHVYSYMLLCANLFPTKTRKGSAGTSRAPVSLSLFLSLDVWGRYADFGVT